MTRFAVIGGTGLNQLEGLERLQEHALETPWGEPSHAVMRGRFAGQECLFLARHGVPHHIPPHRINYQANLWALRELGAEAVLAVNAVGGIASSMPSGQIVIPDQLVDYSWGRAHTFFDDTTVPVEHIDFTQPYDPALRQGLADSATRLGLACSGEGVYGVTQGPRLETAAEIRKLRSDGCDVVGMTGMPEAALAAELGLPYAAICLVVNPAAGLGDEPITLASMQSVLDQGSQRIGTLLSGFLEDQG